jgi:hypothetical protein
MKHQRCLAVCSYVVLGTFDDASTIRVPGAFLLCAASVVQVGEPTYRPAKQSDGTAGHVWELPICSCAQARDGTDNKANKCSVVDCTLHPCSLQEANSNERVHALLIETCIEQAEAILKAKLSRSYSLPKLKFKATPDQPDRPCLTVRFCCTQQRLL